MTDMKSGGGTEEKVAAPQETTTGESPEMVRREFMKRFGVYAAGSAVGLYVLMSGKKARALGSDGAP